MKRKRLWTLRSAFASRMFPCQACCQALVLSAFLTQPATSYRSLSFGHLPQMESTSVRSAQADKLGCVKIRNRQQGGYFLGSPNHLNQSTLETKRPHTPRRKSARFPRGTRHGSEHTLFFRGESIACCRVVIHVHGKFDCYRRLRLAGPTILAFLALRV